MSTGTLRDIGRRARTCGRRAVPVLATLLVALPVLCGAGAARAQLADDARTSTRGTQFVKPPEPPPPEPRKPPQPPPAPEPKPAAVKPPEPPPPSPPKDAPRYPSVVFLVDTSDSMLNRIAPGAERTRLDEAKDALAQVLRGMGPDARVQVWTFNTRMTPVRVPGVPEGRFVPIGRADHRRRLIAQVRELSTAGGTNLYQSVVQALGFFDAPRDQRAYRSGQRFPVLVVVSDGEDGGKTPQTLATVQEAKQRRPLVTVNTIGFKLEGNRGWYEVLCRIATRENGCATADDEAQLRRMLESFTRFQQDGQAAKP